MLNDNLQNALTASSEATRNSGTKLENLPIEIIELILEEANAPLTPQPNAAHKLCQTNILQFALSSKSFCSIILPFLWKCPRIWSVRQLDSLVRCARHIASSTSAQFLLSNGKLSIKKLNLNTPWMLKKLNDKIILDLANLDALTSCTHLHVPIFSANPSFYSQRDWDTIAVGQVADIQSMLTTTNVVNPMAISESTLLKLIHGIGSCLMELTLMEDMTCITPNVVSSLRFPNLRKLSIGCNNTITNDSIINAAPFWRGLSTLRLGPALELDNDALLTLATSCPSIEEFVLVANVNITTCAWIKALESWTRLRKLMNVGCLSWIHDSVVDALLKHPNKHEFEHLSFGYLDPETIPTENPSFIVRNAHKIAQMDNLKGLYLRLQTTMTDSVFKTMILNMSNIEHFDLAQCLGLTDASMQAIFESCPHARMIDLEQVPIHDTGLFFLNKLNLSSIDVSHTLISQLGVEMLLSHDLNVFGSDGIPLDSEVAKKVQKWHGVVYWDWDFELKSFFS
jgi:hypothetical protein